jgi:nuclear GTP-binding protein
VCAVAAQPGHTKDIQSVQLERGIRVIDSPGVIFDDDDDDVKGRRKGSVLLRNVVRVEDIEDPVSVGEFPWENTCGLNRTYISSVEEILGRTNPLVIQKIYNLPNFTSTLEFLTMLALNSGRLLKVFLLLIPLPVILNYQLTGWNA